MRDLFWFLIILIVCFTGYVYLSVSEAYKYSENYEVSKGGTAPKVFKDAHRYHGIMHSYWSKERRVFVFDRNDKECILFSKHFWDWYMKNHESD